MNIFSEQYDRERKRINYTVSPWLSVLFLSAGVVSANVYSPPFLGCILVLGGALLGGMCAAYGPLSRHRWIEHLSLAAVIFPFIVVTRHYPLGFDGRVFSLVLWVGFGLTAPFWIWRKRGLAIYGSSQPNHSDANRA